VKKKTYPLEYAGVKQRYATCVVVGDLIFCSGMTGRTPETGDVSSDNTAEQMVVALDRIRKALEETGSSMENIVKTVMYLKEMKDYQSMRDTEFEYYRKHCPHLVEEPPASTVVQVVSLARPRVLVEVDVVAVIPREGGTINE
jgi:2-iminobutanoate/2-iminopropanoate deaminase